MNKYISLGNQHGCVSFCLNHLPDMSSGPCIVLALSLLGAVHFGSALSPSMSDLFVGRGGGGGAGGGAGGRREPTGRDSGALKDYQERERLKEEVAKEVRFLCTVLSLHMYECMYFFLLVGWDGLDRHLWQSWRSSYNHWSTPIYESRPRLFSFERYGPFGLLRLGQLTIVHQEIFRW